MNTPGTRLPTWATDEIVEAGHADAGYPVKVEPAEPTKAQGFFGGEASPAATDNWLQNAICRWLGYVAPSQVLNLKREMSGIVVSTEPAGQVVLEPFPCHYKGVWIVPGTKNPGSDNDGIIISWPGSFNYELAFEPARISENCWLNSGTQSIISAATDGTDCVLGIVPNSGATNTQVLRSAAGGAPALVTVASYTSSEAKVFCADGVFLLLPIYADSWVTGNKYHTSTDGGATWTEQTIADAPSVLSVFACATGPAGFALCWTNSDKIGFTSDGVSFVYVAMGSSRRPTGITLVGSVAYVLCSSGELMRVTQGGTVSVVSTIDEPVTFGGTPTPGTEPYHGNLLASDGSRAMIALGHDIRIGSCYYASLDLGATWTKTRLTSAVPMRASPLTDDGGRPLGVWYADGEFLAMTLTWPLGDGLDCTRYELWRSPKL